jgi:hypothetical protein
MQEIIMPQPGQRPLTVIISMAAGKPQVDKPEIQMPSDGDEVVFEPNPPSLKFDVSFETTPFHTAHFHNHAPDTHRTGKFDASKKARHKYTVTVNGVDLDPIIIVQGP